MSLKKRWMNFWNITKHFQQVKNPVWNKFKKSNGIIEGYYFIRFMMERGKHHPQMILSMMSEYALVLLAFDYVGWKVTTKLVVISMLIIFILIMIVGYIDVYFDVARRSSSFAARFSPENQTLYKQVEEIHKEVFKNNRNKQKK